MTFLHPHFLWLFLLLPVLILLLWRGKPSTMLPSSFFQNLKSSLRASDYVWSNFRKVLILLLFSLFVLLLARPQSSFETEKTSQESIDIFLAIDVSESMLAEDLTPNRLEAAKTVLSDFLTEINEDRVGVLVFSGKPFTQSPLTFDTNFLQEYLTLISTKSIQQNVRGLSGTAIGDAILSAVHKLGQNEDRSKVLILLTDGDANAGANPTIAAQYAKEQGITVYTIGIGKEGGAPLIYYDRLGQKQFARNRDGSYMMTTFNERSLKEIAETAGGKYYRADDNDALREILSEISQLEKKEIETNVTRKYRESFQLYAWITLGLFLGLLGLDLRKFSFS